MASKAFVVALAMFAAIVAPAMAEEHVVGDEWGWTLGFDYQAWAAGEQFFVGDTLVFDYQAGFHDVVKVNGTDFRTCNAPFSAVPLVSGKDVIPLATPGKKWYICSVGNHCERGMKLVINVWPAPAPVPAPGPEPVPETPSPAPAPSPASWSWA